MKNKRRVATRPIPVRMDEATTDRLDRAATRLVSNRAAVVRFAILQILPQIEAGQITLK